MRRTSLIACVVWLVAAAFGRAAEIHTNGIGGGIWSEPATWHGKTVPAAGDTVVIASGDVASFDRNDEGQTTCAELFIDPHGALVFKSGGKRVMVVSGPIESYGAIRMEASKDAGDTMELRLTASAAEKRTLRLLKGGSLLVYGKADLPQGRRNVLLSSKPAIDPPPADPTASVEAIATTMVDLQRAAIADVQIKAASIDNTGAKPNERLNIADCQFSGFGRVIVSACDTPTIVNNTFTCTAATQLNVPAVSLAACPLAEVRGNTIRGPYHTGITGSNQTDSVITGNTIEKCGQGIYWYGVNAMLKGNAIRNCGTGIVVTSMSGVMEDCVIDSAVRTGLAVAGATIQCTNLAITNVAKGGVAVDLGGGSVTLLNCNLTPEAFKLGRAQGQGATPRVQAMQFLVVKVRGAVPAGATVEVTTANPAVKLQPGAMDLNIRNSPAMIGRGGLTPLPASLKPLILKAWVIESDGKITPAPEYTVTLREASADPDEEGKKIKSFSVTPQASWYRSKPDDATATAEVALP